METNTEDIFDYWQQQPTRSSCGPTSIKIACNILKIHQDKTPLEIFDYCDNQLKGSPWWRMLQMLNKLDISYSAHSGSFEELKNNIQNNKIIIVSIDIENLKHWCVLYMKQENIYFFDPEIGIFIISPEYLGMLTEKRNFFHICITQPKTQPDYFVAQGFKMLDENKMVLIGEANNYFNKNINCVFTKNIIPDKQIFAYNKQGLLMYV